MNWEEHLGPHSNSLMSPWLALYTSRVSGDRHGISVDGVDVVYSIEMALQDLYYPLVILGCCCLPCDYIYTSTVHDIPASS